MPARPSVLLLALSALTACGGAAPPPPPYPAVIAAFPPPRPKAAKKLEAIEAPSGRPYRSAEDLGRTIDGYVGKLGAGWGDSHAFHGYVLVRDRGETVYAKAWGMADRDRKSSLDGDTRFRVGSLTKMFTAAAVLALEEDKKLDTEDRVRKHLPDLPAAWDKITLRQLLSHTSGLPEYVGALEKKRGQKHTPAQVLATVKDQPLAFEPGARFQYVNTNYFVLGLVVEKLSGKPFGSYLAERILDRAGMKRTSLEDAPTLPNSAKGYQLDELDQLVPADAIDFSVPFAAGALRSSPNDLARWHDALSGSRVLTEASRQKLFAPNLEGYAMGFIKANVGGTELFWHNGGIDGFKSFFGRLPGQDGCVVVLANDSASNVDAVGMAVLRSVVLGESPSAPAERKVVPVPAELAKAAPGDYALTDDSRRVLEEAKLPAQAIESVLGVSVRKPAKRAPKGVAPAELPPLLIQPSGQGPLAVFGGEGGVLFSKVGGVELTVDLDPKTKKAKGLTLKQGGLALAYSPGKPKPPAAPAKPPTKAAPSKKK